MRPEAEARLRDALEAIETILGYAVGRTLQDYLAQKMFRQAVERNLEILGEALNAAQRFDPASVERVTAWRSAIDMRNVLIHGYAVVKHEVMYQTIVEDLPEMADQLRTR